jgi:hypothetical protein
VRTWARSIGLFGAWGLLVACGDDSAECHDGETMTDCLGTFARCEQGQWRYAEDAYFLSTPNAGSGALCGNLDAGATGGTGGVGGTNALDGGSGGAGGGTGGAGGTRVDCLDAGERDGGSDDSGC